MFPNTSIKNRFNSPINGFFKNTLSQIGMPSQQGASRNFLSQVGMPSHLFGMMMEPVQFPVFNLDFPEFPEFPKPRVMPVPDDARLRASKQRELARRPGSRAQTILASLNQLL